MKADIVEMLDRMDGTTATRAGFMPVNLSKKKSLLRRALNLAGNPTKPGRRDKPLSPTWDRLLRDCGEKDAECRVRPLAGYCTDQNIEPGQVDEAVLQAYEFEVRLIARSKNIPDTIRKLRRAWNKLVDAFPNELAFRAETWTKPRRWALQVQDMPSKSFRDEMALLRKASRPETFEEVFRCRPLKNDEAVDDFIGVIMRIVTVMHTKCGHPLSDFTSLRYIVQPKYFEATIRALKEQTETDDLRKLGSYVSVLHWLGETWVKLGAGKMRELKALMKVEANPHLFPSRKRGRHTTTSELSMQSAKLIARRTGVVGMTGHKSRHSSVKMHLDENPGDWSTVQEHVGHRDPDTTKTFYASVTQVQSSRRVQRSMGKR